MADLFGEPDIPISHKRYRLVKLTLPQEKVKCIKIFTFSALATPRINLHKSHFEDVKEWLRMRYAGKTCLMTLNAMETTCHNLIVPADINREITLLHVTTEYTSHPTLDLYYQKLAQNSEKNNPISRGIQSYLYYFEQFFEIILRGASIPFFFYTPNNLFISRPSPRSNDHEAGKLTVNILSTVGLELLGDRGDIIKEDLEEIFALLPSNLAELANLPQMEYVKEVNRIIRMKALAWNILCFILRFVPTLLQKHYIQERIVKYAAVLQVLSKQQQTIQQLLADREVEKLVKQATQTTGIKALPEILYKALQMNCQDLCWETLYRMLFLQSKKATQRKFEYEAKISVKIPFEESEAISKKVLQGFWEVQESHVKQFYLERFIPPSSNVYFLIRTNINFHSMMGHLNVLHFCQEAGFCSDLLDVHYAFMRNSFKKIEGKQPPDIILPYRSKIPLPPPQAKRTRDFVSEEAMSRGLSRRVELNKVEVDLTHEMLNTLNLYRRGEWLYY